MTAFFIIFFMKPTKNEKSGLIGFGTMGLSPLRGPSEKKASWHGTHLRKKETRLKNGVEKKSFASEKRTSPLKNGNLILEGLLRKK